MRKFKCCKHCLHRDGKGHKWPCNMCVAEFKPKKIKKVKR